MQLGGGKQLVVPPVHLVPRVIRHAQNTNAKGTLVVPQWLLSPFWPLLFPDGIDPAEFVKEYMELPKTETLILPGQLGTSLFQGLLIHQRWLLESNSNQAAPLVWANVK